MQNKIKLTNTEIKQLLQIPTTNFPKYSTQILNLANQNAQATRPSVVGQMTELIQKSSGKTLEEWEKWYLEQHPSAIQDATTKIIEMLQNLKDVMDQIDRELVEKWVYDLVIVKTFIGLKFQAAILQKISQILGLRYRLATPEEESTGIDGYVGDLPVSIKPETYKNKKELNEKIKARIVYYQKVKDGIVVDISELIQNSY